MQKPAVRYFSETLSTKIKLNSFSALVNQIVGLALFIHKASSGLVAILIQVWLAETTPLNNLNVTFNLQASFFFIPSLLLVAISRMTDTYLTEFT